MTATTRSLIHRTVETGHVQPSPLADVDPDILEQIRPLLHEAIKGDVPVHVGADYWITASLDDGQLHVWIWYTEPRGEPLVTMTVTRGVGCVTPVLEVSITSLPAVAPGVGPAGVQALEDLEQHLAWAWLV